MRNAGWVLVIVAMLTAMLLVGCQQRFTRVRYEFISLHMSGDQVIDAIGHPESQTPDTWTYVNRKGEYYRAIIRFDKNGRVTDRAWYISRPAATQPAAKPAD